MINLIVPIVENAEKFEEFVNKHNGKDVKIFVGIIDGLKDKFKPKSKNVEIHVFANKSKKEEIINSLHSCKMQNGRIMLVRRPLTDEEFVALSTSSKDICTLKARHNGFVSAFKRFAKKIVRRFFGFTYFEDISAICYKENMFELLSVCNNFSIATRINRYVGVEVDEVLTETKPVKREYNKMASVSLLCMWILLFLGSVAGAICVGIFTKTRVLIVVLLIAWLIIMLTLMLVGIVNFTRTTAVGELRYGRAEEK